MFERLRGGSRPAARMRPLLTVLALPLLAIALLACSAAGADGNGVITLASPSPSDGASPSPSMDPRDATLAFAQCMRDHGIDVPDPQVDEEGHFQIDVAAKPGDVDMQKLNDAQQACQHFLAAAGPGPGDVKMDQETQDKILAFTQCMRDHGVDMPDPQFGNGGMVIVGGNGNSGPQFDPNSQEFKEAQAACQSLLPGGADAPKFGVSGSESGGPGTETQP
jgi:hypothetical protein